MFLPAALVLLVFVPLCVLPCLVSVPDWLPGITIVLPGLKEVLMVNPGLASKIAAMGVRYFEASRESVSPETIWCLIPPEGMGVPPPVLL